MTISREDFAVTLDKVEEFLTFPDHTEQIKADIAALERADPKALRRVLLVAVESYSAYLQLLVLAAVDEGIAEAKKKEKGHGQEKIPGT